MEEGKWIPTAGTMPWDVGIGRENIYPQGNGVGRGECWQKLPCSSGLQCGFVLFFCGFPTAQSWYFTAGASPPHPCRISFQSPLCTSPHLHCQKLLN